MSELMKSTSKLGSVNGKKLGRRRVLADLPNRFLKR